MRINQIARKYGLENKIILTYLESIGVHGKSHSSSLDEGTMELLLGHFDKLEQEENQPETPKSSNKFARIRRPKGWKPIPKAPAETTEYATASPPVEETAAEEKETVETPVLKPAENVVEKIETPQPIETEPPRIEETALKEETPSVEEFKSEEIRAPEPEPEPAPPAQSVETITDREKILADIRRARKEAFPDKELPEEKVQPEKTPPEKDKDSKESKTSASHAPARSNKTAKRSKPEKKTKTRTITLGEAPLDSRKPDITVETPEVQEKDIPKAHEEPKKGKRAKREAREKNKPVDRNQEEAIRREIQKLKKKQQQKKETVFLKKPADIEETAVKKGGPKPPPSRRREAPAKGKGKRAWKREKREKREIQMAEEEQRIERESTVLKVHDATTVADIADGIGIPANELIVKLISLGVMTTINQHLDSDTIQIIADEYDLQVEQVDLFDSDIFTTLREEDMDESRMVPRPPVVTIMGHVDHGKTKLLDAVRQSDVVSSEAGGITQHIGAYHVKTNHGEVVFLDTPGHEAFTAMRARGAMVTDIVILVVAATEGVMPQTREAIAHAQAADVPIIVALNKIDLPGANVDQVKQQLSELGLVCEEWGGKIPMTPISAKQQIGIDDLLETVLLQAELLELKADPFCRARGTIVEGKLSKGRGAVATVLIQQGQLKISDPFVTGVHSGRIRAMVNDRGEPLVTAGPSMPVEILGLEGVPSAGDPFIVSKDDIQAKQISTRLQQIQRERDLRRARHITLEELHKQIVEGKVKDLRVIVKGDVQGSVGALSESLLKIESDKVRIQIIHSGVGSITESDVMLASASNALIVGFNVRPHPQVVDLAKQEHVDIRLHRVIYDAIAEIKQAMTGMLDKTYKENIIGRGEIREVFKVSRSMSIAGLYVQDGKLLRNASVRLLRDSVIVHEGKLSSLKRFKDDVREVASGYECGMGLERFQEMRVGDIVECFEHVEVASTL